MRGLQGLEARHLLNAQRVVRGGVSSHLRRTKAFKQSNSWFRRGSSLASEVPLLKPRRASDVTALAASVNYLRPKF